MSFSTQRARVYYQLTKPGIIRGNLLVTAAGFLFGASSGFALTPFLGVIFGTIFIIASGCVFNNYLDRGIDSKMERTKKRALVSGEVTARQAITFGALLAALGILTLALWTNGLTLALGITGLFFYVVVYGWAKRASVHGTLIGSIPGAIPPVAGYTAATGQLDVLALLLFLVLVFWQMPHFYAIAIYRLKDYKAAKLPVLPAVKGICKTKAQMLCYTAGFVLVILAFYMFTGASYSFTIIMSLIGLYWLYLAAQGFRAPNTDAWARSFFKFSLLVLLALALLLSLNSILP